MKRSTKLVFIFALFILPCILQAKQAGDRLRVFLREVSGLRADFTQTVFDAKHRILEKASGVLLMKQPGLFRWDYTEPYIQQVVADGQRIWIFDADLEQVTVRPQQGALDDTPAMLLSGATDLDQHFEVKDLGVQTNGLHWIGLRPKKKDSGFDQIRLGFGKDLERMEMMDPLGQMTLFHFHNLVRNPTLDNARFQFLVPEGVDVIGAP